MSAHIISNLIEYLIHPDSGSFKIVQNENPFMHSIMFIHQCIFCKSSILNEHSKRDRLWISIGMRSKGISTMCSGKECIELISYIP